MNKKPMKFDSNGIAASNSFLSSIALEVLEMSVKNACRRACSDADLDNATYGTGTFLTATDTLISLS